VLRRSGGGPNGSPFHSFPVKGLKDDWNYNGNIGTILRYHGIIGISTKNSMKEKNINGTIMDMDTYNILKSYDWDWNIMGYHGKSL
jgi:hypothetical protein